jgi:thiol:disulfide interchange protein DsbA
MDSIYGRVVIMRRPAGCSNWVALILISVMTGSQPRAASVAVADAPVRIEKTSGIAWQPGESYVEITPARATGAPPGKVQVIEFFQYQCPHCYTLEPYLTLWNRMRPEYVEFVRVPVTYRPSLRALARLYYTLVALGRVDVGGHADVHHEVYDSLWRLGGTLTGSDDQDTLKLQAAFAKEFGIDPEEFSKAYHSPTVEANVARADELVQTYRIDGTPMLVVNGKYKTHVGMAGGEGRLMNLLTDLSIQEHTAAKK